MIKEINWDELTPSQTTNFFLFGQALKPSSGELLSDKWINRASDLTVVITEINSYMKSGPGRFANASQIELVQNFFNYSSSSLNLEEGGRVEFSLEEAKIFFKGDTTYSFQQSRFPDVGINSKEYWSRVYIYETQEYKLNDDVKFVIEKINGTYKFGIDNFSLIPMSDNFDFIGGNVGDGSHIKAAVDPTNIGKVFQIEYDISNLKTSHYDFLQYISDRHRYESEFSSYIDDNWNIYKYLLGEHMIPMFSKIWEDGTTQLIDSDKRAIIHLTNNSDQFNVDNIESYLPKWGKGVFDSYLEDYWEWHKTNGVAIIAGDGNDKLVGGDYNDYLDGGEGADTLEGGKGNDTYIAGNGDTIQDIDQGPNTKTSGGEVYFEGKPLTGGTKVCTNGDDASDVGVYEGDGGFYTLNEDHTLTFTKKLLDGTIQKLTIKDWDKDELHIHLDKQCEPSPEHEPCPSPTNPLVFPSLPLPSKPSYGSSGGSSSGGGGGYYGGGGGGGTVIYHKPFYQEPECYISPVHSSAGAGGGGGSTGPVVLDLNHNGITSLSIAASLALFDYDGDGLRENTAWVESGDALLVSDLNSDGIINDASEFFGNYTKLSNGSYAKSGYQALEQYDTNQDGVIDANDSRYSELKLWIDANGDGVTDAGELISLSEAGVSSVTLSNDQFVPIGEAGNTIIQESSFADANGESIARDVLFRYENNSTTEEGVYFDMDANGIQEKMTTWTQPNQWLVVKDLNGDGKITSGKEVLGNHFILSNGTTATDTMAAIKSLDINHDGKIDVNDHSGIAFWTDRNHNGVTDVGELEALGDPGAIQVIKLNYFQVLLGAYSGDANGVIDSSDRLFDYIYLEKNSDETFTLFLPESDAARAMIKDYTGNETITTSEGDVVVRNIQFYGGYEMQLNDELIGSAESETLEGSRSGERIAGGGGRDIIDAKAGNDIIEGGTGSDKLIGGSGDDTYIFNRGDGRDLIVESSGVDTISFGAGITSDDLIIKSNGVDISIYLKVDGKSLSELSDQNIIKDWYGAGRIESLTFEDGSTLNSSDIMLLFASDKNDTIYGTNGDDTLAGARGNDVLIDNNGDDTYIFNRGDGKDVIFDTYGSDVLQLGEGITQDDLLFQTSGNDLIVALKEDGVAFNELSDTITLKDWYVVNHRIESIELDDKTILAIDDISQIMATEGDDVLVGDDNNNTIDALGGNDAIDAGRGNDIIEGGTGNDTLQGGAGNDTYIFNRGDGQDIIEAYSPSYYYPNNGTDTLQFGEGITQDDLLFQTIGSDLVVALKEDGVAFEELSDTITLKDWYNPNSMTENIMFFNGETLGYGDIAQFMATDGDDIIQGTESSETISALDGNDTINAGSGNDIIYGGAGNDVIDAGNGNNLIQGGIGNDAIYGGYDNDTYIFNRGDGQDTIKDNSSSWNYNGGNDTLQFGEDITQDDLIFKIIDDNLVIALKEDGVAFEDLSDMITIKDYYSWHDRSEIENIKFTNGDVLHSNDIIAMMSSENDDILRGTNGSDVINALDGDDTVDAEDGNDMLQGGKGNDTLKGGDGNDTYIFNRGDGQDIIDDNYTNYTNNDDNDMLQFGEGITKGDLLFKVSGDDLIVALKEDGVAFEDLSDVITIKNWYNDSCMVENIKLNDDTLLTSNDVIAYFITEEDDIIRGTKNSETISALAGDDIIDAGSGNNIINAGKGNDTILAKYGSDTYIFNRGDGNDTIYDHDYYNSNNSDTLQFGEGITRDDLLFQTSGNNLIVALKEDGVAFEDLSDTVTIKDWYYSNNRIENIKLNDGTILGATDVVNSMGSDADDTIKGTEKSEIIKGGLGNDTLQGGDGNDTYIFNRGDGQDVVYDSYGLDTLQLGEGITQEDLLFQTSGNNLIVALKEDGVAFEDLSDTITIKDWYSYNYRVENIELNDGTALTSDDVVASFESEGDDTIKGTDENDIINAGAGNDTIDTGYGDDVINAGSGNDTLQGGDGNDTYIFNRGDGQDVVYDSYGSDTLQLGEGITQEDLVFRASGDDLIVAIKEDGVAFEDLSDTITLKDWYDSYSRVESIKLSDGTILTSDDVVASFESEGDDYIKGTEKSETINAGAGNDIIDAGEGENIVNAGDGDDIINAGYNNDMLQGGAGNDTINAGNGNNIIEGGIGNDELQAGYGADTYIFNRDDGQDIIMDTGYYWATSDTLQFGEGITQDDLLIKTEGNDLIVALKEDGVAFEELSDTVTIKDWLIVGNRVENINFEDGTNWSVPDIVSHIGTDGADAIEGTELDDIIYAKDGDDTINGNGGNDTLYGQMHDDIISGGDGNDVIEGNSGNDMLSGNNGNDILSGNEGNDILQGGTGNDTYMFNRGDGVDEIYDIAGIDTLQFGEGIMQDDLLFQASGNDLIVALKEDGVAFEDLNDTIIIKDWYNQNARVENIQLNDGAILDVMDIINMQGSDEADIIKGTENDEIIEGGLGNDTLQGGAGNDTYIFNHGDGVDEIYDIAGIDTLQFGEGIMQEDLLYQTSGNDLIVALKEDGVAFDELSDKVTLKDWYLDDNKIENIRLSDGSSVAIGGQNYITGTEESETIEGTDGNDVISGLGGDDILQGRWGNDTYIFNRGDGADEIYDAGDSDTLQFGEGITQDDLVFIADDGGMIILLKEEGKSIEELSEGVFLRNWHSVDNMIEKIAFDDGTILLKDEIIASTITEGDDDILGTDKSDSINALGGDDIINAGEGHDTIFGGTGNDMLQGGIGNDTLFGGAGNDIIDGGYNNDILKGGLGNDELYGGSGDDTYIFNRGDGQDIIYNYATSYLAGVGSDTLQFGEGITQEDLLFKTSGDDLIVALKEDGIVFDELGDKITLSSWCSSDDRVENIKLSDGTIFTAKDIVGMLGTEGNDNIQGTKEDDIINALGGDDVIDAGSGNDIIQGGLGNDMLQGGYGDDTYIFNRGDGQDIVSSWNGDDVLRFGEGITQDDLIFQTSDNDLIVALKEDGKSFEELSDAITLQYWHTSTSRANIELNDGIVLTSGDIVALMATEGDDNIRGTSDDDIINALGGDDIVDTGSGNDIIEGGAGSDTLIGGNGDDIYIFNRGDGADTIYDLDYYGGNNDTLQFGEGIIQDDLIFRAEGINLIVALKEDGKSFEELTDKVILTDWFLSNNRVESFILDGGEKVDLSILFDEEATDDDNVLQYGGDDDIINALGGDDIVNAGLGNDTIEGGVGNDTLFGEAGDDIYVFNRGDGQDVIYEEYSRNGNVLQFGEGVTIDDIEVQLVWRDFNTVDLVIALKEDGVAFEDLSDTVTVSDWSHISYMTDIYLSSGEVYNIPSYFGVYPPIGEAPIILDLNGNEITSIALNSSNTYFDYDGDGNREHTAWIERGDALLAVDINNDGIINDGSELFGNHTKLPDGSSAQDGYWALQQYDSNNDGIIDENDTGFDKLLFWRDTNLDGQTAKDEISTLQANGIVSISLSPNAIYALEKGNQITYETTYSSNVQEDGLVRDLWFQNDLQDTMETLSGDMSESGSFSDSFEDFETNTTLEVDSIKWIGDSEISSITLQSYYTRGSIDGTTAQTVFEGVGYSGTLSNIWLKSDPVDTQYIYNEELSDEVSNLPNAKGQGNVVDLQDAMNEESNLADSVQEFQTLVESDNLNNLEDNIDSLIEQWALYDLGGDTTGYTPPIVLDLNGDLVTSVALEESKAYFDYDGDGRREHTAWVQESDGILVYDKDENGVITDGSELFGNYMKNTDGTIAGDGYEAMRFFDSDDNGVLNEQDVEFSNLKLWIDANGNGKNDGGELISLIDQGILEIDLDSDGGATFTATDENGNIITNQTNYSSSGDNGIVRDIWFKYDIGDSIAYSTLSDSDEKKISIVENFYGRELNIEERHSVEVIAEVLRQYDAVKYDTIAKIITDRLYGEDFPNCTYLHNALNNTLARIVYGDATTAEVMLGSNLLASLLKTNYYTTLKYLDFEYLEDPNISYILGQNDINLNVNTDGHIEGNIGNTYFGSNDDENYDLSFRHNIRLSMNNGNDQALGTDGVDVIDGGQGDDYIDGNGGKDVLIGGQGDDTLIGGIDQNVYMYSWGDGNDIIYDAGGEFDSFDTLRFANIDIDMIAIERIDDDMVIHILNEIGSYYTPFGEPYGTITIKDGYASGQIEYFYFDGTRYTIDEVLNLSISNSVYHFNIGDGSINIADIGGDTDSLYFGEGINSKNIEVRIDGDNLMIGIIQEGKSFDEYLDILTIEDYVTAIENFYFEDGETLSLGSIVNLAGVDLGGDEINDAPTASDATVEAIEDTLYNGVLPQASDVDGDTLTYSLKTQPANGTVVVNEDGTYTYTPNENFNGEESFTYEVSDGELVSEATITLNVAPVNDSPEAFDATVEAIEDTLYNGVLPQASDVDGDTLTYSLKTQPANGTVVVNEDGTYTYTPNENFNGEESFTYEVSDGELASEATITLNVAPVNDSPEAFDATVEAIEDTLYNGVLPQASDVDGDTLTYSLKTQPANGTVVVNEDGTYTYTPNENFNGEESFTYEVSDGELASEATITLNVAPVNDSPEAFDATVEAIEDTLYNGVLPQASDVDGDTLTYSLKTQPANGTVVVNEDGTYTYTPNENFNGEESFTYEVSDGELVSEATITLNVANVRDDLTIYGDNHNNVLIGDRIDSGSYDTIYGYNGRDTLKGLDGNDTLYGGNGNDTLYGGNGDDILDGGRGSDRMYGGAGDDVVYMDNFWLEYADGGAGNDTLSYAHSNHGVVTSVFGSAFGFFHCFGKGAINFENLEGSQYSDILSGDNGNNAIYGNRGNDTIYGDNGNDILYGEEGRDTLYGGRGEDIFVFDTELSHSNIDKIMDFSSNDDTLYLDNEVFAKLIEEGTLSADNFVSNTLGRAEDSDDYIIYESDTGKLFYDADGNGSEAAIQIAQLGYGWSWNTPTITHEDIVVI